MPRNSKEDERLLLLSDLVFNDEVLLRVSPQLNGDVYFPDPPHSVIETLCHKYHKKYGKAPGTNIEHLVVEWANKGVRDKALIDLVERLTGTLIDINKEYESKGHTEYSVNRAMQHLKMRRATVLSEELASAAQAKNTDEIDKLMDIYQSSSNPDIQHSICSAVTDVRDPALAQHIIDRSIADGGFVRPQDIMRWYAYLMRNQYSREAVWKWLANDWGRLEKVFGSSKTMDYMPVYAAGPLSTTEWEKKYKDFFTPLLSHIALNRNIKVGFSEIEARVAWRKREEPKLKKYF